MKTLTTLLFTLTVIAAGAQNFELGNGQLVWQKVYETPANMPALQSLLTNVQETGAAVNGTLASAVDYKSQGIAFMQLPVYMRDPFTASVTVETKTDRYRVTVKNIDFKNYGLYELMVNRRGELNRTAHNQLPIIDRHLSQVFTAPDTLTDW